MSTTANRLDLKVSLDFTEQIIAVGIDGLKKIITVRRTNIKTLRSHFSS